MSSNSSSALLSKSSGSFTSAPTTLLQRKCVCGGKAGVSGGCSTCVAKKLTGDKPPLIQPKLRISQPNDKHEQEADRIADEIMRMPEPKVQRQIEPDEEEEEDEMLQRKPLSTQITPFVQRAFMSNGRNNEEQIDLQRRSVTEEGQEEELQATVVQRQPVEAQKDELRVTTFDAAARRPVRRAVAAITGSGRVLSSPERAYFEPRFGCDFSHVRIHEDVHSGAAAEAINAQAYTLENHIVFAPGAYNAKATSGRRLLAHELAHVVQREKPTALSSSISRAVNAKKTSCPPDKNGAPSDPIAVLKSANELAQAMARNSSFLLTIESIAIGTPELERSLIFQAYREWFGTPISTASGHWQSRFGSRFSTEDEAIVHEMDELSDRFDRLHGWLSNEITYKCVEPRDRLCREGNYAGAPPRRHEIQICEKFWNAAVSVLPPLLIHEAVHGALGHEDHDILSPQQRAKNSACYQNFAAQIHGLGANTEQCERTRPHLKVPLGPQVGSPSQQEVQNAQEEFQELLNGNNNP